MRSDCKHEPNDEPGRVRVAIEFDPSDLRLKQTPFGALIELRGAKSIGPVGGPALPSCVVKAAVPHMQWPTTLVVEREHYVQVTRAPTFVAPAQPLRPGVTPRPDEQPAHQGTLETTDDRTRIGKESTFRTPREGEQSEFPEPFPAPPVVPPDVRLYEQEVRSPRPLARPLSIQQIGLVRIAQIEINPMRFNALGHLELCTRCELVLSYGDEMPLADKEVARAELEKRLGRKISPDRIAPRPEPVIASAAHARRLVDITRAEVVNPELVRDYGRHWPTIEVPAEYLIITDDNTWNAQTVAPDTAIPGMVAAFGRLADWKVSRGVSTRVVTITDIVGGRYGDFRTGARDLQEVIRGFLKTVVPNWGVAWVLLGGDIGVVPIRQVAGRLCGDIAVETHDPPGEDRSFWTGSYLKMKVVNPGVWWPGTSVTHQLVNPATGEIIPYDSAGTSNASTPGWYFTTDDTYGTRTASATQFVRVNGPDVSLNATLQWLYKWNTIPTDLYYASLDSHVISDVTITSAIGMSFTVPWVFRPEHDWDALDNGLYGQHNAAGDLDGVVIATDVSVGRAPVGSAQQADAFASKVIAYESFRSPVSGLSFDGNWPRRVVLASSDWGGPTSIAPTTTTPPGDNLYHHAIGAQHAVIKLENMPADFDWELIAEVSETDRRLIPYAATATDGGYGWHFARSATDLTVNEFVIPMMWGLTVGFPLPSPWIAVFGPTAEVSPQRYLLDRPEQDGSMADQEQLRAQLQAEIPGWDTYARLYQDDLDLTPAQAATAPVQHLTSDRLTSALNRGPHIVSLSGHGSSGGCCGGSVLAASGLSNGFETFIVYADSCLTNQIDAEDAFSEALVYNPNGGAVGYVGNTRFSWIGLGDDFQRAFFHRLSAVRNLGLLHDSRCSAFAAAGYYEVHQRWAIFALNLLGDPEMQVRKSRVLRLSVSVADANQRRPFVIKVVESQPLRPVPDPRPLAEILVHVRQGDKVFTARTNRNGEAAFDLSSLELGEVEITASHDDFVPHRLRWRLTGPDWVHGVVTEVSHMHGGPHQSLVRLRCDAGERSFVARQDRPDYRLILDAVENAFLSKTLVSLMVNSVEDGGVIERFRFTHPSKG